MADATHETLASVPACPVTPLIVVGGGTMARALVGRAAASGLLDGPCVIAEPDPERRRALADLGGAVEPVASAAQALDLVPYDDAAVLLAVKPQVFAAVADELARAVGPLGERLVVSIMAGVTIERVRAGVGGRVVRAMPNLPASVGAGATALAVGEDVPASQADRARRLFAAAGRVFEGAEGQIDAFTALAGSGPAYLFLVAEAMAQAGEGLGLPPADARAMVAAAVRGAGAMLADGGRDPADLRRAVSSEGGTTRAALDALEAAGVGDAFRQAVNAAARRAAELGQGG